MDVAVLYLHGCPHRTLAQERLAAAFARLGRDADSVRHVLVEGPGDAERLGFIGSPTILVDGEDPFATGDQQPAFACRLFSTPDGLARCPTVDQLVEVPS